MPTTYNDMSNEMLTIMAVDGDYKAKQERLIRNIMAVDNVEWEQAHTKFIEIQSFNRAGLGIYKLPFYSGFTVAMLAGTISFPMIFHLDTVKWFNELYVTTEVPPPEDLETPLEVGGWAWNWMEPPLGQLSFAILCLQFARGQMLNLNKQPYTTWVKSHRGERLSKKYVQYSSDIVSDFGGADSFED
jgi:hypothetical protein